MSDIENLKRAILRKRESNPKSAKAPGSSPLNLYVAEILALREEGFGYAEIADALYLQHQVKTDERVLSKFMIRYRKRAEKLSAPRPVSTSRSPAPISSFPSSNASGNGSLAGYGAVKDAATGVSGTEKGSLAGEGGAGEFVSTSTLQQRKRKETQLRSKTFAYIHSTKNPIVRESFKQKYGNYPEHFEDDLAFWEKHFSGEMA